MILVTGAAGKTGQAVIRALARRSLPVRALVFRENQQAQALACGAAEVRIHDMGDTAAFVQSVENVRAVYHLAPNVSPFEVDFGENAIAAAQHAGARLVFHSVLHPQTEDMPHHWHKLRVEEKLLKSGLDFTILQPAAYMQNTLAQWHPGQVPHHFTTPYNLQARLSLVDLNDVAEAAARVLSEPGHNGASYQLCGPVALSQLEVAACFAEVTGEEVQARQIAPEVWAAGARKAGLSTYAVDTLLKMFAYYDKYGLTGSPFTLTHLLDRPPTDFTTFLHRHLAQA